MRKNHFIEVEIHCNLFEVSVEFPVAFLSFPPAALVAHVVNDASYPGLVTTLKDATEDGAVNLQAYFQH